MAVETLFEQSIWLMEIKPKGKEVLNFFLAFVF